MAHQAPDRQGGPSVELEAWLALVARVLVFLLGLAILIWQNLATVNPDRVMEVLGFAMLIPLAGPILLDAAIRLLFALRGKEPRR